MSSRFVSGGAIDSASGEAVALSESKPDNRDTAKAKHQAEWEAVERELEEERRKRAEARQAAGTVGGEKSLYEVLQANKAAKQAEFEETHKLKNQFRALDDDEIEFLDGILESSRAEEERVRKETQAGLDQFRQEQQKQEKIQEGLIGEAADETGLDESLGGEGWHVSGPTGNRKRKRREDKTARLGVKRKSSAPDTKEMAKATEAQEAPRQLEKKPNKEMSTAAKPAEPAVQEKPTPAKPAKPAKPETAKPKLVLVDYGSDGEDSED